MSDGPASGDSVSRETAPPAPELARGVFGSRLDLATTYAELLAGEATVRGLIGPREVPRTWDRHVLNSAVAECAVEEGATVAEGDVIVVMEAMKMEQPLKAHKAGTVTGLSAEVGATVTNGAVICELKD